MSSQTIEPEKMSKVLESLGVDLTGEEVKYMRQLDTSISIVVPVLRRGWNSQVCGTLSV